MIRPKVFGSLDSLWGPHDVDRFVNNFNAQIDRFNSRFWCPGTDAVDAFTCDWGQDITQVCFPPYTILHSIRHAAETRAIGTLVVPSWPTAPFWPIIFLGNNEIAGFIRDIILLPKSSQMLLPGRQGYILTACNNLASHFDFTKDHQGCQPGNPFSGMDGSWCQIVYL